MKTSSYVCIITEESFEFVINLKDCVASTFLFT